MKNIMHRTIFVQASILSNDSADSTYTISIAYIILTTK